MDTQITYSLGNYFFELPNRKLFKDADELIQDREVYWNETFMNLFLFTFNEKIFTVFKPSKMNNELNDKLYIMGFDPANGRRKYFSIRYTNVPSITFQVNKDKLFIHAFVEENDLSNEQKPITYHIYDMAAFDF